MTETSSRHGDEDDVALAAQAARGDREGQRALVVRLLGYVRRTVRALLRGDAAAADDAVQLSMLEVLRSAANYRGEGSLERWAGRIAARTTLHFIRQLRGRGELSLSDREEEAELAGRSPPDARSITPTAVQAHLALLPEARRICLVLRYVHGYSVEEVATLTNVSPNTVKDRLLQGRAQMRKSMQCEQDQTRRTASPARRPRRSR